MTAITEGKYPGQFLLSESDGLISRDNITLHVAAGIKLNPGRVIGKISGGAYVAQESSATDGSETAVGVLYGNEADNTDGNAAADFEVVIVNFAAEVRGPDLSVGSSVGTVVADLATHGVKVRGSIPTGE
jgi:hypothetical protein